MFFPDFLGKIRFYRNYYLGDQNQKLILRVLENLITSRIFEEKVLALAKEGRIEKKWIFSGFGQEGCGAMVATLLNADDPLLPSFRGYAPVISRGYPLLRITAEILGKDYGSTRGQGSSCGFSASDFNIFQHSDILGSDFGTILGIGYALKKQNSKKIGVIFFGDGAATRGPLWSALNIAAIQHLPILWVCENNQFSMSTRISDTLSGSFISRSKAIGIKAKKIDGNDVAGSFFAIRKIIDEIREKRMPAFIELCTYRIASHDAFFFTDQSYQNAGTLNEWKERDPLSLFVRNLLSMKVITFTELLDTKQRISKKVNEVFAEAAKLPVAEEIFIPHYE